VGEEKDSSRSAGHNEGMVEGKLDAIDRALTEFKQGMWKRVEKLEEITINHSVTLKTLEEMTKDVSGDYKDTKKWFTRLILGAIFLAMLALILKR
jgi:hypothetical protein